MGSLDGLRVVVTRARLQASVLVDQLEALGANAVELAMIEVAAPEDGGAALRDAVARLDSFGQVVVSSPNGARVLLAAVESAESTKSADGAFPPVACVGPSTAAVFDDTPWHVNVVPDRSVAEGLIDSMSAVPVTPQPLLLVQAAVARPVLADGLEALGWHVHRVVGYQTIDGQISSGDSERAKSADAIVFTSSSTVERFVRLVGLDALPPVVASIGPITSQTAHDLGVPVTIEAREHTIAGVVAALSTWAEQQTS